MDQRVTRSSNRLSRGRGRSRNAGNLHVIKTSVPVPISNSPEYIRTVTMTAKKSVLNPEPPEVKNVASHKAPLTGRVFSVQKDAAMSFTKKKINAAKNFLQQQNKASPVKKSFSPKVNLTDDNSKPSLSSNNVKSNLVINSSLPTISPTNIISTSPNGSVTSNATHTSVTSSSPKENQTSNALHTNVTSNLPNENKTSNLSNNSKPKKYKPISISHQSHACLALYEVDMSLKARKINTNKTIPKKDVVPGNEKKDIVTVEEKTNAVTQKEKKDATALNEKKDTVALNEKKDTASLNEKKDTVALKEKIDTVALNEKKDAAALKEKKDNVALKEKKDNVALKEKKDIVALNENKNTVALKDKRDSVALKDNKDSVALKDKKDSVALKDEKDLVALKEKKNTVTLKGDSGSSWVPINMMKTYTSKDLSVNDRNVSFKNKNPALTKNGEKQNRSVYSKNISKPKKKGMKEVSQKMFRDSKGEKTVIRRYSNSSRHFLSREEEDCYYEKRYGLSRNSKTRRSRDNEREHKQHYRENDRYHFTRKSHETKSFHEELDVLEDVSDVPLDEDFEEVETASVEDSSKPSEIPVGFRKYKIRYLASKSIGFFKPKRYSICQDRTVVSCLNMEEEEAESVDVVSEAEYETDHTSVVKDSKTEKGDNSNIVDDKLELTSKSSLNEVSEMAVEPEKIENDLHIPGKHEEKSESGKQVADSSEDLLIPSNDLNNSAPMETNETHTVISKASIKKKQEVISGSKFYYTCISESDSPNFYQGCSLYQKYFDEWNSHLIGLEYLVELRDMDKTQVQKYYCGLCSEQLTGVNIDGQTVTNHVSGYKHASAYMAKHFPSCGYKFLKNESSSNILQRCCKEINHKLSYYFLCVTTDDYFQKHEKEINELFGNLPHWNETDINIDPKVFVNKDESDMDSVISQVIKDIINKVAPGEEIATFITSRNEHIQELRRKKSRNSNLDIQLLKDYVEDSGSNSVTSGRNLIVLTPQHGPITKCSSDLTRPALLQTPKCSNDLRPNLLQVITHEQNDSSVDNSNELVSQAIELSDLNTKDVSENTVSSSVDSDVLSNFKSINKKAVSYRKYRAKQTTAKSVATSKGTEHKEISSMRTVRKIVKNSGEITVCLESKSMDESSDRNSFEEVEAEDTILAEEFAEDISNESGIQVLEDSTMDSNFSDSLGVSNVLSPQDADRETNEASKSRYKTRHRSHQKATHSKHCLKRILGRNSRSAKESAIKKESGDFDVVHLDSKSNDSLDSELERKIKDLSPVDSKDSISSRKITSPLRTRYSPVFSSDLSRMSVKRRSRSPPRRRSRSPVRRRRSPMRRSSRSPARRGSRSPARRRSRSPRRQSRSPVRRRSRSPKRRSRSPARRSSRSPARRRSRSPVRRRSRSPFRRRSRSPIRRRSRSPIRRRSRSPIRRRSRSPIRRRSRSPIGRRSRSPKTSNRRKSRSPVRSRSSRKISVSPSRRAYPGDTYAPLGRHLSPLRKKFESDEASYRSESRNSLHGDSASKSGSHKEFLTSSRSHYPRPPLHESECDLDPISDDEEPAYFNTLEGPRHLDEIKKLPEPTRSMVMQLLQKFSASKVTPRDPSFSELMQFVNSHNSEMSKPHTLNQEGVSNMPTSRLALQRFLLSNLSESSSHQSLPPSHALAQGSPSFQLPHSSSVPFEPPRPDLPSSSFSQSVFPPANIQHHGPLHHSVPPSIPQVHSPAYDNNQQMRPQFRSPQFDNIRSQNEPSFEPKTHADGMFKNLKAAVNKLFGANEGNLSQPIQHLPPRQFMAEENKRQWGQDPRNSIPQYDSLGPKNVVINDRDDSDFRNHPRGGVEPLGHSTVYPNKPVSGPYYPEEQNPHRLHVPPPDAKVAFCDAPRAPVQKNLFPVISSPKVVDNVKVSLAQRLAAVLVKVGMLDVPGPLLQEMLMKIGAFSACPPQDITEGEIIDILKRLGYLNRY